MKSKNLFHLSDDIYIISGTPFLIIKNKKAVYLVLSDIHFGQEEMISNLDCNGISHTAQILTKMIVECVLKFNVDKIILNGDIKHVTSTFTKQEKEDFYHLMDQKDLNNIDFIIIMGNHDSHIMDIIDKNSKIKIVDKFIISRQSFNIIITHGHKIVDYSKEDILILGHEHPAYVFRGNNGEKIKLHAFISKYSDEIRLLIILPASSSISSGVVFPLRIKQYLSPIIKSIDWQYIQIFPFNDDVGVLALPKIPFEK